MTHPTHNQLIPSRLIAKAQSGLDELELVKNRGKVVQIIGLVIESQGPRAAIAPKIIMSRVVLFTIAERSLFRWSNSLEDLMANEPAPLRF